MIDGVSKRHSFARFVTSAFGFRVPSSDAALTEAVQATNSARRAAYARSAQAAGTTTDVAGARMFEGQLLPRISSGQWYRNAQGQWVQR